MRGDDLEVWTLELAAVNESFCDALHVGISSRPVFDFGVAFIALVVLIVPSELKRLTTYLTRRMPGPASLIAMADLYRLNLCGRQRNENRSNAVTSRLVGVARWPLSRHGRKMMSL